MTKRWPEVTDEHRAFWALQAEAKRLFGRAVREGTIVRQSCEVCGKPNAHGHHEDYNKPLDVVWLCTVHHHARHREIRRTRPTLDRRMRPRPEAAA